ncbi:MAG TPA: hypothetical protein VK997_11085 [Deferrisomatales bacterium]|nr:hypothetical protein [Deferrisomatales bacterium]
MFIEFFYKMKEVGIPVSPTSFLTLQRALSTGLVTTLDEFYTAARSILVKSERYFDLYDQVFAYHFDGVEMPDPEGLVLDEMAQALLENWLADPKALADALGVDEDKLKQLSPEELIEYFKKRLEEQRDQHHGGYKWIGTGGYSPVGHGGYNPGGMRVGGVSHNKSAVKVAMDRRYRDYSQSGPLTRSQMGEALKRLRNLRPEGPRDQINVDASIYQTMKNAGEIEIVFERGLRDRLKVVLAIDNGGWSMEPYIPVVQTLFDYARAQFKDLKTYFFHNTVYGTLWEDPARYRKPHSVEELARRDPETRFIFVGDASMAPYELLASNGSIHLEERSGPPSIAQLKLLAETFPHSVWLNPTDPRNWGYTRTIGLIGEVFPMFELTLDGLGKAVAHLMTR